MLTTIQLPFADLRPFLSNTGRRIDDQWSLPFEETEDKRFIRAFGSLDERAFGGLTIGETQEPADRAQISEVREAIICNGPRALRFSQNLDCGGAKAIVGTPIQLSVPFRRLYVDTVAMGKYEVGIAAAPEPHHAPFKLDRKQITDLLRHFLHRPVTIPNPDALPRLGQSVALEVAGDALAWLYALASTDHDRLSKVERWWVQAGRPAVVLTAKASEMVPVPLGLNPMRLRSEQPYKIYSGHLFSTMKGRKLPCWMIVLDDSDAATAAARDLRLSLLHLYALQESMGLINRALERGHLKIDEGSAVADRLTSYRESVKTLVSHHDFPGTEQISAALLMLIRNVQEQIAAPAPHSTPVSKPRSPQPVVLDLTLTTTAQGADICWKRQKAGQVRSAFRSPYCGEAVTCISRILECLQHPDSKFQLTEDEIVQASALKLTHKDENGTITILPSAPQIIGRALYDALVSSSEVGTAELQRVLDAAGNSKQLMIHLHFPPDATDLTGLPWELLWAANQHMPLLRSTRPATVITRHLDKISQPPGSRKRHGPLRIKVLTPRWQRGVEEEIVQFSQLWKDLQEQGIATIEMISPVTQQDLTRLRNSDPPDIVQFIGHGGYGYHDQRGVLFIDKSPPGPVAQIVDAYDVIGALCGVRLAIFTACRGAHVGPAMLDTGIVSGFVPTISAAGVPVVIGMQTGIRISTALDACRSIYTQLAKGASVQAAFGNACADLYDEQPLPGSWYVPVLYMQESARSQIYL
jgi:hypothetical protein